MAISIRTLSDSNLESADFILRSAFQRPESWRRELQLFIDLQPAGVFIACQQDNPVGMVAGIIYSDYAYVGLMGVHQDFQRQGIGLALMSHLLDWLDRRGVQQVVLDASPFGQPLYEKLGFVPFDEIFVFQRQIGYPASKRPDKIEFLTQQNLDLIAAPDTQAFGASRKELLQALLGAYHQRAFLLADEGGVNGYLIAQEKRIGPWVADSPGNAALLLDAALSLPYPGLLTVTVPGENVDAIDLLPRYGFELARVNRHMARGTNLSPGQRESIYAQASLSLG